MIKFVKTSAVAAGLGLAALSANAAFTANDLYIGFTSPGAASDYIVDLGQPGTVGVGGSTVVDLSSFISQGTFNSVFTGGPTNVNVGVIGGKSQFPSSYDLYVTAFRTGGAGGPGGSDGPGTTGSDLTGFNHSQSTISSAVAALTGVALPTAGNGNADGGKTWTANISPTFTANSFFGSSGIDPMSSIGTSGIVYEDLWEATSANAYAYLGYFTFDFSTPQEDVTFTPLAVPEPTAAALFALGGFAWAVFLRKFKRANA